MRNFEELIELRVKITADSLKSKAESLKSNMEILIRRIVDNRLDSINSLGEVQALGSAVDARCSELSSLLRILEDYKSFEDLKTK